MSYSKFEPGTVVSITPNGIERAKSIISSWFEDKRWSEFVFANVDKPWVISKVSSWFTDAECIYHFTNGEEGNWALPICLFDEVYTGNDECNSTAAINSLFGGV